VLAGLDIRPGDDFFDGAREESGGGRGEGEKVFEGSGQFIFRALFDPLTGEDKGGDGGGGIEKEGWLVFFAKKYPKQAINVGGKYAET
jgi:hypothetical protein